MGTVRSSDENAMMHPFVKEHGLMLISLIYNNATRCFLLFAYSFLFFIATMNNVRFSNENAMTHRFFREHGLMIFNVVNSQ